MSSTFRNRLGEMVVTFFPVGSITYTRRQQQTAGFAKQFDHCQKSGPVKNFHPRHKPHC